MLDLIFDKLLTIYMAVSLFIVKEVGNHASEVYLTSAGLLTRHIKYIKIRLEFWHAALEGILHIERIHYCTQIA